MANSILTTLGSVFTSYVPSVGKGLYDLFVNVFCATDGQGAVTGLNELGITAIVLFGIAIVSGLIATVMGVLKLRKRSRKYRKAKR